MIRRTFLSTAFALTAVPAVVAATTSAQASVEISSKPTQNMNCADGVCTPTAKNADLNATDLANMLATSDVKVVTGNGAVTITVSSSFSWTSTYRLTLDANLNVSFRAPVVIAGQGAVTIVTNDGGTGGDLLFFPGGKLDFGDTSSGLVINGTGYTLVSTIAELRNHLRRKPTGNFALGNDYDASVDGTFTKPPIGNLQGVLEGLGHSIANLQIASSDQSPNIGLFSENQGTIRDLQLTNVFVSGFDAGGLVGDNLGTITHVVVTGTVQSTGAAGGIVSHTQGGTISYSTAAVNVQGINGVGGLVGYSDGTIDHCGATGTVSAESPYYVGGLAGYAYEVLYSYATGAVIASGDHAAAEVGGLVGYAPNGFIKQSFATGPVTGGTSDYVAGLSPDGNQIEDSYSTGTVQAGDEGELGGFSAGGISVRSYSTGLVTVTGPKHRPVRKHYIGGFTVFGFLELLHDYWDIDTSGTDVGCARKHRSCRHVTGLSDVQLKSALPKGFRKSVWGQSASINNGYPYLLANPPPQ